MDYEVRIHRMIDKGTPVKAVCSVTLDGRFAVHGVKLIEINKRRFIAMPSESYIDSKDEVIRKDICHPVTSEARAALEKAVLDAYDEAKNERTK